MYPFSQIHYIIIIMNKIKSLLFSIIILFLLVFVYYFTYRLAEPKAYDFMVRNVMTEALPFDSYKKVYGSEDIVLVVVDDKSAEKYRWPWKRDMYCKLFGYFKDYAKPAVVVHDANIINLDKDNPQGDKKFFNLISQFDNLIEGFMPSIQRWENLETGKIYDEVFLKKYGLKAENHITKSSYLYSSLMQYPKEYFDSVKYTGTVSMLPGFIDGYIPMNFTDEIYRTHEYVINYKGTFLPSLAMRTFMLLNNNPKLVVKNSSLEFPDLGYKINQKTTSLQSVAPIRYYKLWEGYSHRKISAVDIMDSFDSLEKGQKPLIAPEEFQNKIVVIGVNVPTGVGLNDNKNTPVSVNHPGVDIQATVIDNILHNEFVKVVPPVVNILLTVVGMLLVYSFIRLFSLVKSIVSVFWVIILYTLLASMCFYFGVAINLITPLVMFIITMIIGFTHKFILENKSKEKVKTAMGKYMSQDVMKRVVMDIDNLGLGGKKATVTVLFADIRGFTSLSETMPAQQVSEMLNEYFTEMEPIITKYNGIINKFIGDAVMAIFGEPIQDKNHASKAVKCGFEMLTKVKELQAKWAREGKPKIEIGVGINTGEVFVGNIGSVNRMEYTVIGDTVNLASRLESYNKIYKTKMLISASTYEETKSFVDVIKISNVEIRGKAQKMDIYEVLSVIL